MLLSEYQRMIEREVTIPVDSRSVMMDRETDSRIVRGMGEAGQSSRMAHPPSD